MLIYLLVILCDWSLNPNIHFIIIACENFNVTSSNWWIVVVSCNMLPQWYSGLQATHMVQRRPGFESSPRQRVISTCVTAVTQLDTVYVRSIREKTEDCMQRCYIEVATKGGVGLITKSFLATEQHFLIAYLRISWKQLEELWLPRLSVQRLSPRPSRRTPMRWPQLGWSAGTTAPGGIRWIGAWRTPLPDSCSFLILK